MKRLWIVGSVVSMLAAVVPADLGGQTPAPATSKPGAAPAAPAAAANAAPTREESIRLTLAAIDQELKDHGGTFEKWGASIKPYRDQLSKLKNPAIKWPWPAKHDFAFQGREIDLVMLDTFDNEPEGKRPFEAILEVHKRLKEQGVDLIYAPLPDKLAIYPDYLSDTAPADKMVTPAVKQLMKKLLGSGVECVDLYPAFYAHRKGHGDDKPLYYDKNSHWRNLGAQLAAAEIARPLMRYDFVRKALAEGNRYSVKPDRRQSSSPEDILVVLDAKTGGRYADAPDSPILITGDSNLMMNMGTVGGHMPAHVGRHIGLPLAFGSNTIPSQHYGKLGGKKVVIWSNIARMLVGMGYPTK